MVQIQVELIGWMGVVGDGGGGEFRGGGGGGATRNLRGDVSWEDVGLCL